MKTSFIIGVDDTDNLESRGTGFRVREMVMFIHQKKLAEISMITRHQLFVHPGIPYTSHNSSASVTGITSDMNKLQEFCENYLLEYSAIGSDAGFCLSSWDVVSETIMNWGNRAKKEILTMEEASKIAADHTIVLSGLTGERTGIIGSLAAVGLRKACCDGRILWMPGLRETQGIITAEELQKKIGIERIINKQGEFIPLSSRIDLGDWFRPVMNDKTCTLYVEETEHNLSDYRVAAKDFIKSISD